MSQTPHIILNKELRRDIDAIIQRIKQSSENNYTGERAPDHPIRRSRERSLVITKLQEAVMWLGMDLKSIGEEMPPCPCCKTNARVSLSPPESKDRGEFFCPCNDAPPEGMAMASGHFDADRGQNPYPNSKNPSNTVIDPTADNLKL